MKRLMLAVALMSAAAVAACDDPRPRDESMETMPPETPAAPAAEDVAVPAAETAAPTTPPTDPSTLPPEQRTSEETVRPESETLFY